MSLPAVFRDLSQDSFPFRVEMYDVDSGEVYNTEFVEGPGSLYVAPKPDHVREAGVRVWFANGEFHDTHG